VVTGLASADPLPFPTVDGSSGDATHQGHRPSSPGLGSAGRRRLGGRACRGPAPTLRPLHPHRQPGVRLPSLGLPVFRAAGHRARNTGVHRGCGLRGVLAWCLALGGMWTRYDEPKSDPAAAGTSCATRALPCSGSGPAGNLPALARVPRSSRRHSRPCAASSSWTAYRTPVSETKYRVPARTLPPDRPVAGHRHYARVEIDGVDGWTLSVRLRQGHRPLAVERGSPPTKRNVDIVGRRIRPPRAERPSSASGGVFARSGKPDTGSRVTAGALRITSGRDRLTVRVPCELVNRTRSAGAVPNTLNAVPEHDVKLVAAGASHPQHAADRKTRKRTRRECRHQNSRPVRAGASDDVKQ